MRTIFLGMALAIQACTCVQAQEGYWGQPALAHYRATPEAVNDLVHIKLDVRFDYKKCYLYGKEWVTLRPHFYQTDSLRLDAKGMDIAKVMMSGKPLSFFYDSQHLVVMLDRMYRQSEEYTIYIEYTSTKSGFDLALTRAVSDTVSVPVIASGGVGNLEDLADGITKGGADAVLAASIFHYGEFTVRQAKEYMQSRGIPMRL